MKKTEKIKKKLASIKRRGKIFFTFLKSVPGKIKEKAKDQYALVSGRIRLKISEFKNRKSKWLLDEVKNVRKANKDTQIQLLKEETPFWIPSFFSFSVVFFVGLWFFLVSHPWLVYDWILRPLNQLLLLIPYYDRLSAISKNLLDLAPALTVPYATKIFVDPLSVHAGVGAVLVGLAFFVAQSMTEKNDSERARVLLYKSNFFPLLVSEILVFFLFWGEETNALALLAVATVAGWTIISIASVINILLRDYKMEVAKKEILFKITKGHFIKTLNRDIIGRIGNNILTEMYAKSAIMQVNPFGFLEKKGIVSIVADKSGLVSNINLRELAKLVSKMGGTTKDVHVTTDVGKVEVSANQKTEKEPLGYMRVSLHRKVKAGEVLFQIKESTVERIGLDNLKKRANSSIVKIIEDYSEEEARTEIAKLKDKCFRAIIDERAGELEKMIRLYVDLVNEFLRFLKPYGVFDSERAKKERGAAFFGGFKPLQWLSEDIREVFEKGIGSDDSKIIRAAAYLPVLLVQRAIENNDHLIFQEFSYFARGLYERGYELSKKPEMKSVSDLMLDRSHRYLEELTTYHLESKMRNDDLPEEDFEKDFRAYAVHIFQIYQGLLKSAFDKGDVTGFVTFLNSVVDLFERLGRPYMRGARGSNDDVFEFINGKRAEMLFGLASWIFFIWQNGGGKSEMKIFYDRVVQKLPTDISEFTKTFLSVHDFDTEDFWGWDHWESSLYPSGRVHRIQVSEKLERFFAVRGLELVKGKTEDQIQQIALPHNSDLAFLVDSTREIPKTLEDIEKNTESWNFVLDASSKGNIAAFRAMLKRAKDAQEQDDLKQKRETPISPAKVEEFKEKFLLSYKESGSLKALLQSLIKYKDKSLRPYKGSLNQLGINTMFDKGPFFGDEVPTNIHYIGIDDAFGFGKSFADGEAKDILRKIEKNCSTITKDDFKSKLSSISPSNLLIIATNQAVWKFFDRQSSDYIPNWRNDFPRSEFPDDQNIEGVVKLGKEFIPVYEVFVPEDRASKIFILDKSRLGEINQYSPLGSKDDPKIQKDIFTMNVEDFVLGSAVLEEFLSNPPQWLTDVGNRDEQIKYLQERVVIKIFERFEFIVHEKFTGFVINLGKG